MKKSKFRGEQIAFALRQNLIAFLLLSLLETWGDFSNM